MRRKNEKTRIERTDEEQSETVNNVKKSDNRKHFVVVRTCNRMKRAWNCRKYIEAEEAYCILLNVLLLLLLLLSVVILFLYFAFLLHLSFILLWFYVLLFIYWSLGY